MSNNDEKANTYILNDAAANDGKCRRQRVMWQ